MSNLYLRSLRRLTLFGVMMSFDLNSWRVFRPGGVQYDEMKIITVTAARGYKWEFSVRLMFPIKEVSSCA